MKHPDNLAERGPAILLTLMFGPFISMLDSGIINVGLPSMAREFAVSPAQVQWVSSAYLLTISLLLPFLGALADRVGRKLIYSLGYLVLSVFTLVSGWAPSLQWLVTTRILQALGAAMIIANGMALATENYPASVRGRNLGILSTTGAVGSILGPAVGGLIIGALGWRSVFPITFAAAAAGSLAAFLILPRDSSIKVRTPWTLRSFLRAVSGAELFRSGLFRESWGLALVGFVSLLTPTVLVPFYFETVGGMSPQMAGMAMMGFPLLMALTAPWSGRLSDRYGPRPLTTVGLAFGGVVLLGMTLVGPGTPWGAVAAGYGLTGLAMGLFQAANNSALMGAAPKPLLGSAAAYTQLARNLGTAAAAAGAGTLFTLFQGGAPLGDTEAFVGALKPVFAGAGVLALVASAASLYSWKRGFSLPRSQTPEA